MRIEKLNAITPLPTSDYANRDCSVRNVTWWIDRRAEGFVPVVCGIDRKVHARGFQAEQYARKMAEAIASDMRNRGIRARAVRVSFVPDWLAN